MSEGHAERGEHAVKGGRKRPIRRKRSKPPAPPAHERGEEGGGEDGAPPPEPPPPPPPVPVSSFEALTADFEAAIDDLAQREGLENLHTEFLRVFRRLEEVQDRERELTERVAALEAELAAALAARGSADGEVSSAPGDNQEDEIAQLRTLCDALAAREQSALETLEGLRRQLEATQQKLFVEQAFGFENMDDAKKAAKLARERDLLLVQVATLRDKDTQCTALVEELQQKVQAGEARVEEVVQKLAKETDRKQREATLRVALETDYKALQSELEAKKNEMNLLDFLHKTSDAKVAHLEASVAELTEANEAMTKDMAALELRIDDLRATLRKRNVDLENAVSNWQDVSKELHHLEGGLVALENKVAASESMNRALGADLSKARARVSSVVAEAGRAKLEARELQRFLNATRTELAARDRDVRGLDNTRGVLVKRVTRLAAELSVQVDLVAKKNSYIRDLEKQLEAMHGQVGRLQLKLEVVTRERGRLDSELARVLRRMEDEKDAVLDERLLADRYKKELTENNRKLAIIKERQRANDMHAMMMTRQAAAAVENEEEMRLQVRALSSLAEQLKEEVAKRDLELAAEKDSLSKMDEERTKLNDLLNRQQAQTSQQGAAMRELQHELLVVKGVVRELEQARDAVSKQKSAILNERDAIGTQLVRRNDEVQLLRRKVGVLEQILRGGERELLSAVEAVRLLKLEVGKLRWERQLLARQLEGRPQLERQLYHTYKDLTRAQHLARALEDELAVPVNFHRWRRLEGSDLPHLQLLEKVRVLQRRSIHRAEQMVVQEQRLRATEALYLQLRKAFLRQSGDPTTLMLTRAALQDKQRKMKGLMVEVGLSHAAHSQLEKANKEITRLQSAGPRRLSQRLSRPTRTS